MSRGRDG